MQNHRSENYSKATARIDPDVYERVRPYFPYGLQTMFFQKVFAALDKKIQAGEFNQILDFIYDRNDLILEKVEQSEPTEQSESTE